jgi:2'-5' RNA ligase
METVRAFIAVDMAGEILEKLEKAKMADFGRTWIDSAELIQSKLSPKGAEYTVLHRVPLSPA